MKYSESKGYYRPKRQRLPKYYSASRVKKIFKEHLGYSVYRVNYYYKNRQDRFTLYDVCDDSTGKRVMANITLYSLGLYLEKRNLY